MGWALHALEPEEETRFATHLPACPRCLGTVAEAGEVLAALATALPAADPSVGLREELRAAVGETGQVRRQPSAEVPVPGGTWPGAEVRRSGTDRAATGFADDLGPDAVRPATSPTAWRRVLRTRSAPPRWPPSWRSAPGTWC